jgi:long-chain acyl-CoA synthetase
LDLTKQTGVITMNLYTILLESAQRHQNLTALQWEDGQLSYQELLQRVNIIGNALRQKTGGKRQHVALLAPNSPTFIFGFWGILGSGNIAVPLNPLLKPEEMVQLVNHGETFLFLYDPHLREAAQQVKEMAGIEIEILSIPEILQAQSLNPQPLQPQDSADDVSMILYTSGTTGNPKGVMLTHKNFYSNYQSYTEIFRFTPEDTFPCFLPLFHSYAMTGILLGALFSGARIILFPQFIPQKVLDTLTREPNVILIAVPPMLYLLAHMATEEMKNQHKMRVAVSGGGPLPMDVSLYFQKKLNFEILEGYGLTETSPVVAINPPGKNRIGTIGPAMPDVQVQVRDEQGNILSPNQVGELCVRGDLVMKGYYKNPEATQAAFWEDGWLRTGDLASIDEDGYIKIVGRSKDLIVSGGENIYPREVEETLLRHPAVREAAVVAKPNKLRSEVPYAFVVLHEETRGKVSESDLRKFCRDHLAEFKVPDEFEFLEVMPKTAKGTPHKAQLQKKFEMEKVL